MLLWHDNYHLRLQLGKVARYLSHARNPGGCHWREEVGSIHGAAISTHFVLSGAELATLSRDFLEIFLRWRIGIADLPKSTLRAYSSSVVQSDNLLADFTALETK
jgi:hypothetical protein